MPEHHFEELSLCGYTKFQAMFQSRSPENVPPSHSETTLQICFDTRLDAKQYAVKLFFFFLFAPFPANPRSQCEA